MSKIVEYKQTFPRQYFLTTVPAPLHVLNAFNYRVEALTTKNDEEKYVHNQEKKLLKIQACRRLPGTIQLAQWKERESTAAIIKLKNHCWKIYTSNYFIFYHHDELRYTTGSDVIEVNGLLSGASSITDPLSTIASAVSETDVRFTDYEAYCWSKLSATAYKTILWDLCLNY